MRQKESKTLLHRGISGKIVRMTRLKTQKTREKAVENLEKLAEIAHAHAISEETDLNDRRDWARLETYIRQTINNITQSYDESSIEKKLRALKRVVDEELGKRDQPPNKEGGKAKATESNSAQRSN